MQKYYIALIISKEPINLPEDLLKGKGIRHLIAEEFEVGEDIISDPTNEDYWQIKKSAPKHCGGINQLHYGNGLTISVAILNWLKNLCASTAYNPFYFQKS
ncbi:MAG: hypothetical protein WC682_03115 [Parcubacteria group bacterium]|jgi:hypothetical protein